MRSRNHYDRSEHRQLNIRCTAAEYEQIRVAAALDGKSVAQWMREILLPLAAAAVEKCVKPKEVKRRF